MNWHRSLRGLIAVVLMSMVAVPPAVAANLALPQGGQQQGTNAQPDESATTPSANTSAPAAPLPQPSSATNLASPGEPQQAPSAPQNPTGTAAAPDTRPEGVAASTPSGAAIAPAPQKRVRRFSIRTAILVGAVVAVGVVVGLSAASSSRP